MKDYFIVESTNLDGVYAIHDHPTIFFRDEDDVSFMVSVDDVKFTLGFIICERDIPSFYK